VYTPASPVASKGSPAVRIAKTAAAVARMSTGRWLASAKPGQLLARTRRRTRGASTIASNGTLKHPASIRARPRTEVTITLEKITNGRRKRRGKARGSSE